VVKEKKVKLDMTKYVEEHVFTFDKAYDETVKNETIFQNSV
jgi:kinesin family protein 2/24